MVYAHSDTTGVAPEELLTPFKIVIGGGFGVGKTTLVGSISEVRPLNTEETLSTASIGVDSLAGVSNKRTTTVALDYGRLTLGNQVTLYLFGLPGQERFSFLWDQISYGALGAVVMADVRRLDDCFASVNYFEKMGLTFAIALNVFDESPIYDPEEVRAALDLDPDVPIVMCDARESRSVRDVLITLVETIYASQYRAESRWA